MFGVDELFPVLLGLVGVGLCEFEDGGVKAGALADVAGEGGGIAGAGVSAGEEFAAEIGVVDQGVGREGLEIERTFVIVELANEEVALMDGGPAEEGIRLELHGALAFDDAAALMGGCGRGIGEVGGVGGGRLFLDLQEERVVGAVAFEIDAEVAQADGAGADDFEGDIDRGVLVEEVAAFGLETSAIDGEGGEDVVRGGACEAFEQGRCRAELACGRACGWLAGRGIRCGLPFLFRGLG